MNTTTFTHRLGKRSGKVGALLGLLFLTAGHALALPTIIIDAGHGGHDLGADDSLVYEKHINLDVARRLERTLNELGFRTVLTRQTDDFIPLDTRADIANKQRNALFVSVHFNSSWKTKVTGIETFHHDSQSREFAEMVQRYLVKNIGAENRGVKTASFLVLRKTRHPAVLVEGGFVSNDTERAAMMDPLYRQVVADSIARGVVDYANAHRF
ncbi:MAG TPA: N-acetylmuramoyl-L-alanine amidase [Verrucomicrobiales bacterium]|nr:N-acetylmuramoyl-L-alanine amidase [Verrucomicrobiae bacterium]MCP5552497.1 N-acetylmuramoyl-L-alanine amidase [Akkermansiaceae bacterium]HRX56791.1 N-acetylmuramoyl-L-alanine amidase [Verrucomicrobiales bacterium]